MFENLVKNLTNDSLDKITENLLKDPYEKNMFVMVTAATKLGLAPLVESGMRGESGTPLYRPYGSYNVQSPWNMLFLNPTQLFKLPTYDISSIDMKTTIGKNAKKPITLSMPIMITGMSYGASLSLEVKTALAKAASIVGISTNTGESGLCAEEREAANILIGQYNRFNCMRYKDQLSELDGIEVQLGQGAWGGAVMSNIESKKIKEHMRNVWRLEEGENAMRTSRLHEVNNPQELINIINELKEQYDIPVGVKIAGSHFIEKDLEIILQTKADFITIDGAEGGTAGAPATLEDDLGLPTIYSLSRAVNYLKSQNAEDKFDIIIAGGLKTPGEFLKALALGAKAVYIGSIALAASVQAQSVKVTPAQPTPQIFLYEGEKASDFDVEQGAKTLANFLTSCSEEMKLALMAMGKTSICELCLDDLVSVNKDLAEALGIANAWTPCI